MRLIITNPVHVTWYGTFVTTPQLSRSSGKVNIKTEVVNSSERDESVTLVSSIQGKDGILVGRIESTPGNFLRVRVLHSPKTQI